MPYGISAHSLSPTLELIRPYELVKKKNTGRTYKVTEFLVRHPRKQIGVHDVNLRHADSGIAFINLDHMEGCKELRFSTSSGTWHHPQSTKVLTLATTKAVTVCVVTTGRTNWHRKKPYLLQITRNNSLSDEFGAWKVDMGDKSWPIAKMGLSPIAHW
jgi:hypothetical protein